MPTMVVSKDSSTYPHAHQTQDTSLGRVLESEWSAFGTLVVEKPLESCSLDIPCCTSASALVMNASVVANRMSLVSNRWESKAAVVAFGAGGRLASGCELVVGRNGHVGGCQALGLGCSRRMGIGTGPSSGVVGRWNPLRRSVDYVCTVGRLRNVSLVVSPSPVCNKRTELVWVCSGRGISLIMLWFGSLVLEQKWYENVCRE